MSAFLDEVISVGGFWERIFGGVLLVHLPPAEQVIILGQFNSFFSPPDGTASSRKLSPPRAHTHTCRKLTQHRRTVTSDK